MKVILCQCIHFLPNNKSFEYYIYNIICKIYRQQPTHSFQFLSCGNSFFLPEQKPPPSLVSRRFSDYGINKKWRRLKTAFLLKKEGPDRVISLDGYPLQTTAHQILILSNSTDPETTKTVIGYFKAGNLCTIVTSAFFMKETLIKQGVPADQIIVLPPVASSAYQFFDWEKRESIKEKYTAGKEYFLLPTHSTSHESIINVLKAFSQFKKWQQSNMQLMVVGQLLDGKKIRELLQTYKYRPDVTIVEDTLVDSDNAAITASAMTMIYLPASEGPVVILKEALQSGTPVITVASPAFAEACADAVLYSDPLDVQDLARNMMKLYKDEKFRNQLIKKGVEQVLPASEAVAVQTLWNSIQQELTA